MISVSVDRAESPTRRVKVYQIDNTYYFVDTNWPSEKAVYTDDTTMGVSANKTNKDFMQGVYGDPLPEGSEIKITLKL